MVTEATKLKHTCSLEENYDRHRQHVMILVLWMLSFKPAFSLSSFTFIKELFTFCRKGGIICISEVIDISPGNLDSTLCFIQPDIFFFFVIKMFLFLFILFFFSFIFIS